MKILVTGALGFIGSHFVKCVLSKNADISIVAADVVGVNRFSNQNNINRLKDVLGNDRFKMYYADFARDTMTDAFQDVDTVVHFGAKTFVDYSIRDPQPFIESNIIGTFRILEEARRSNTVKKVYIQSSDEVYGSILEGSYKEDARLSPSNPYAATKAGADMLALSYVKTYSMDIRISRMENIYGSYQGKEKVIPTWVRKALADESLPIYGKFGDHVRQWCHIDDAIQGVLTILSKGTGGEIYHIAGSQELKNIDLAKIVLKTLSKPADMIKFVDDSKIRPGHDKRYALSSEKLRSLGWKPRWDLETGIPDVVNWYKNNSWWTNG